MQEKDRPLMVFTWSGASATFASKARPKGPIFALATQQKVVDRLALVWGVTPMLCPPVNTTDDLISVGEQVLRERGHVTLGEELVVLAGSSPWKAAENLLKVYVVGSEG
jgi:pyruvate kinase